MLLAAMHGVALVTGAASGVSKPQALLSKIGQATARAFISAGVTRLGVADVQADKLEAFMAEYAAGSVDILPLACDVADAASVKDMVQRTVRRFGRLDYAVNCAGITGAQGPISGCTDEDWNRVIGVNQNGVFYCLREQLAVMEKQELEGPDDPRKTRGAIVNIASIAGMVGVNRLAGYVASKHAVVGLAKSAAIEYGAQGIRVNTIAPGYIDTPMTRNAVTVKGLAHLPPVPMQRAGVADEVADVAVFLASPGASFVNGATWAVDGGYTVV